MQVPRENGLRWLSPKSREITSHNFTHEPKTHRDEDMKNHIQYPHTLIKHAIMVMLAANCPPPIHAGNPTKYCGNQTRVSLTQEQSERHVNFRYSTKLRNIVGIDENGHRLTSSFPEKTLWLAAKIKRVEINKNSPSISTENDAIYCEATNNSRRIKYISIMYDEASLFSGTQFRVGEWINIGITEDEQLVEIFTSVHAKDSAK